MADWKTGSLGTKGEANGGNVTPVLAGGGAAPAAGDVIVVVAASEDNIDWSVSGYTLLRQRRPTAGEQFAIWGKNAAGGDSNPVVTHTGGASIVANCGVIEDCAPVEDWIVGTGSDTSGQAGTVDPPEADCLIIMAGGLDDDQAVSGYANATTNATWSERIESLTALGTDMAVFLATGIRAADTDTGAGTFTPAGGNPAGAVMIAVPPAGGGGTDHEEDVNDTVTSADAQTFDRGLLVADTATAADALAFDRGLLVAEAVTAADAQTFDRSILVADSVTVADEATPEIGGGVGHTQEVDDGVTVADTQVFDRVLLVEDGTTATDAQTFDRGLLVDETVTLLEALAFDRGLLLTDGVTIADNITPLNGVLEIITTHFDQPSPSGGIDQGTNGNGHYDQPTPGVVLA
jgi:hypothetical protein